MFEEEQRVIMIKILNKKVFLLFVFVFACGLLVIYLKPVFYVKMFPIKLEKDDVPNNDNYRLRVVNAQLTLFASGVKIFYEINRKFPIQGGNLKSLLEKGKIYYGDKKTFSVASKDPWGTDIKYFLVDDKAVIISAGIDKKFNSNDDISYFVIKQNKGVFIRSGDRIINSEMVDAGIRKRARGNDGP